MNKVVNVCVTTTVIMLISLMPANHIYIADTISQPLTKANALNSVMESAPKPVVIPEPIVMSRVVIVEAIKVEAARVEAIRVEVAKVEAIRVEVARVEMIRVEVARAEAIKIEVARVEALAKVVASRQAAKPKVEVVASNTPATAAVQVSRGYTGRVITVQASAYTATGSKTATGTWPKEGRTIAVDPSVIKPGTSVRIKNMECGVGGVYIAEDTGGGVKGMEIDIYMNSQTACFAWGRRTIQLEILSQ